MKEKGSEMLCDLYSQKSIKMSSHPNPALYCVESVHATPSA